LIQAWIAVGSGGVWEKIWALGNRSFLSAEPFTDFIFAVVGRTWLPAF
jgi:cell division protein FtsW (lipid II flippase)